MSPADDFTLPADDDLSPADDDILPGDIYVTDYKAGEEYLRNHNSIENILKQLENIKDSWKSIPFNIAVTGQSGSGKSSLINALRGLKEEDVGAAQVGEKETSSKYCSYPHPNHGRFIFWDLPGVGTDKFPQKTYMESIHASRYDFFLIVSSGRFHSQDIWLANEVLKQKHKSRCYFVRSKVDIDMKNRKRRHALEKDTMTDADLFLNFRVEMTSDILKTLHNPNINIHLFLVSSHFPSKYDFEDLQLQLLEDALNIKRLLITFGMTSLTKRLMEHKRNALRLRQREIALLSCKSENTNVEVVFPCSIMHIQSEIKFYKEQLSLDTEGLDYAASSVGLKSSDLRKKVEMKSVPTMSIDSLIKSLNELYRSTYANQSYLTKQWRYYIRYDMIALKTIETFLQGQLDQAMRDTENLIDFITNMKESSVV
ncbi:T-cell-specific guanine nucleotide triphosphate-binding protein 2-like [Mercenaria mercenaria]|uniref:T-cell-specific guanine nucleotide triphosphate-binding protein 2-like n=1 Tax=Mercenaria mercenaria TaxID=6596 RepID=UPI00234FB39C|nr:T-cell-specific guanine nucleotide triphosphate-binding protein 2-like [Mercenaria mercenaria]